MESKNAVRENWIIQVRDNLQREEEEEVVCVSVFGVPKELLAAKPEAYTPQCVSIGPYHHWKSELYEMQCYKVAAARRFQKGIHGQRFESVVEEVGNHDCRIRSCYHKDLDYSGEELAWLMALDASFMLKCLQFLANPHYQDSSDGNRVSKLLDPFGRSATHNATVRDMMMLENQVPLFLLVRLLEMQLGCKDMAEKMLCALVSRVCKEVSPFLFNVPDGSMLRITERSHILEALYFSFGLSASYGDLKANGDEDEQPRPPSLHESGIPAELSFRRRAFHSFKMGPFVRLMIKLPLRLLSVVGKLPVLRPFKWLLNLFGSNEAEEAEEGSSRVEIPPTRDELDIPSVADLFYAGVKFLPTDGDLTTIRFDKATATLYLPKLRLDSNTEVILRNLVAFEASVAPGALIFTRYTDFMNGIIDTDEDVQLLTKSGILSHHLESDGKVASLWNGMGKCVKLTKARDLDKVIADVNSYYNRTWSVAITQYVKKFIFRSWQCLSLLAVLILLLLTLLQTFCSFYKCGGLQLKDNN